MISNSEMSENLKLAYEVHTEAELHTLYCPNCCIYLMNLQSRCVIGSLITQILNRIAQDSAISCCRNGLYINMTIVVVLSEKVGGQAFAASLIDHLQHGSAASLVLSITFDIQSTMH